MLTKNLTYTVNVILEDGQTKPLSKKYQIEAQAEASAFYLLGVQTPVGLIVGSQVIASDGDVISWFEY